MKSKYCDTFLPDYKFERSRADSDIAEDTGRLEVSYLGVTGRICATNWTDNDAKVFCKSDGYTSGFSYVHSHYREYDTTETKVRSSPFIGQFKYVLLEKLLHL